MNKPIEDWILPTDTEQTQLEKLPPVFPEVEPPMKPILRPDFATIAKVKEELNAVPKPAALVQVASETAVLPPKIKEFHSIRELLAYKVSADPDIVFEGKTIVEDGKECCEAFLRKGDSFTVNGGTGAGKSTAFAAMIANLALGRKFCGLKPRRPIRIAYAQKENHHGDLAQALQGAFHELSREVSGGDEAKAEALVKQLEESVFIITSEMEEDYKRMFQPEKKNRWDEVDPHLWQYQLGKDMVSKHKVDLFILDPKGAYFIGSSTDEVSTKQWLGGWKSVLVETGLILGVVDHTSHRGDAAAKNGEFTALQGKGDSSAPFFFRAVATLASLPKDPNYSKMVWTKRGDRLEKREFYLKRVPGKIAWEQVEVLPFELTPEGADDPKAKKLLAKARRDTAKTQDKEKSEKEIFRAAAEELWHQLDDEPVSSAELCESGGLIQQIWGVKRVKAFAVLNQLVERSILKRIGKLYAKDELDPQF